MKFGGKDNKKATDYTEIHRILSLICVNLCNLWQFFCNFAPQTDKNKINMYRSKTCGELRLSDAGSVVTLAGWVQRSRKMGGMTFVDLRDRYGLTQLVFNEADDAELCERANKLGREFCIQVKGEVSERQSKNPKMPTGDIEILVKELNILSESQTPPFTIEDNTDGGDDIRIVLFVRIWSCVTV